MHEIFLPYTSALLAVCALLVAVVMQSFISTYVNLLKRDGTPGAVVEGSHEDQHWRIDRAFKNSLENLSPFTAAVFCAIFLGVNAGWLGTIAWLHVVARVIHWIIYTQGIGKLNGGPRTISFVIAFGCTLIIATMAMLAGL